MSAVSKQPSSEEERLKALQVPFVLCYNAGYLGF